MRLMEEIWKYFRIQVAIGFKSSWSWITNLKYILDIQYKNRFKKHALIKYALKTKKIKAGYESQSSKRTKAKLKGKRVKKKIQKMLHNYKACALKF